MSEAAHDGDDLFEPDPIDDRYAPLEPGGDQLVIYDCEKPRAWVQSTHGYDLHEAR